MERSNENLELLEKRNSEIKNNFFEVLKKEKSTEKTFSVLSSIYFLSPITLRHIVYNSGTYRKNRKSRFVQNC